MSSNSLNHLSKSNLMLPSLLPESKPGFKLGTNYSLPIYSLCRLSDRTGEGKGQVAMGGGGGSSRTGITNGWTLFDPFSLDSSQESDWKATVDAVLSIGCDDEARFLLTSIGPFACLYERQFDQGDQKWKSVGSEWKVEAHPDGYVQKVKIISPEGGQGMLLLTMSTHAGLQCWSYNTNRQQISSAPLWALKEVESEWKDFDLLHNDIYLVTSSTLHQYRLVKKGSEPPHLIQKLSLISSGESEKSSPEWSAKCLLVGQLASYSRLFIVMNRSPLKRRQGRSASYLYIYEKSTSEQYVFRKSLYIYEKSIVSAKLHSMGHLLAFGSNDGSLLIYELTKKVTALKCLRKCPALHSLAITGLEFQNDETTHLVRVMSASPDTRVLFTDLQGLELGKSGSHIRNMLWFILWTLVVLLLAILYNSYTLQ